MSRRRWTTLAKVALKGVLAVVVLAAVGRNVASTWADFRERGRSLHIDAGWLAASGAIYLLGLGGFGVFFWRVMGAGPTPVGLAPALRAYLVSHLGKYVPGKAVVVLIRAALVVPYGARPASAAFATLYETLVMMAAGGLVAALGFAMAPIAAVPLGLGGGRLIRLDPLPLSLALGVGFLVLVAPRAFPRLAAVMSIPFPNVGPEALPRCSARLLLEGLLWASAGWVLLGISQVGVVFALVPDGLAPARWPVVIAAVALATVSGFVVAVLPGGLGVREWVLMKALAPAIGPEMAVLSALALRLTWVVVEILAAGALTALRPPLPSPTPSLVPEPIEP